MKYNGDKQWVDKHGFIGDKGNKVKNCLAIRQNKGEGQGVARKRYIVSGHSWFCPPYWGPYLIMENKAVFDISLKNKLNSFYTNIKIKLWKKM
jgi:hypothetical protein